VADNVIQLPRPKAARPQSDALGFFIRVGRNDHKELLDLIAGGEDGIFGFVVDAQNAKRHRALLADARRRDFDVILEPKTQPMALPGGHSDALAELPWGLPRHHTLADFDGDEGRRRVEQIVDFALEHRFTQLIGPTHVLAGPNDPWLRRDIQAMKWAADAIKARKAELGLIYSMAVSIDVLRREGERRALIAAIEDAPKDAIWLRIENFGDDASGDKTAAFIDAAREFHHLGVPVVADHVGGLPGLAALAFGAVGGIAHGVTVNQSFSAARWRRPPTKKTGGGPGAWRVYLGGLDMLVSPAEAGAFLATSARVKGKHACKDTRCCARGQKDMLAKSARHALYQQAREIDWLSETPQGVRAARYVEERVRRVSDEVAAAAALNGLSDKMKKALAKKQASVGGFRKAMGHLVSEDRAASVAIPPPRRAAKRS